MIVLYILFGVLLLLILLLSVPVGADILYENKPFVRLRYGWFGFNLDLESKPKEKKKKKPATRKAVAKKTAPKVKKKKEKKPPSPAVQFILDIKDTHGISGLFEFFFGLLRMLTNTGSRIVGLITMPKADLLLIVRGADAAETAVQYGQMCAVVYPAFEVLCKVKPCRNQRVSVVPDYEKGQTEGVFSVSLRIVPILVIKEGVVLVFRALAHLIRYRPAPAQQPKAAVTKKSVKVK